MVIRIIFVIILVGSLTSCCDDSIEKTQSFTELTTKWFPVGKDDIHFSSNSGLSETFNLRVNEHIDNSGYVQHKKCSWTGERSSFVYRPVLYGKEFSGNISVGNGEHNFAFNMNNRSFWFDLLNEVNIRVTNVPTNECYVSNIRLLDSLVFGDTTLKDLLVIVDPMVDSTNPPTSIQQTFLLNHLGIVRYDYADGTIWTRLLD